MTTINCVDFCCASGIQTSLMALGLSEVDVTGIVLAVIGMVSGWCSWWLDRRKHKQEVEGLKADNRLKDMELGQMYVEQFEKNIAEPLRRDVRELREKVDKLTEELEHVKKCACYSVDCPHRIRVLD